VSNRGIDQIAERSDEKNTGGQGVKVIKGQVVKGIEPMWIRQGQKQETHADGEQRE
jgi:hypothetical protein